MIFASLQLVLRKFIDQEVKDIPGIQATEENELNESEIRMRILQFQNDFLQL